jgi:hypothetical protein
MGEEMSIADRRDPVNNVERAREEQQNRDEQSPAEPLHGAPFSLST